MLEESCPHRNRCALETEVMTAEELLERYATGERDFRGITLYKANLIKVNLSGADFSNANLSDSYLIAANLKNCVFQKTCLEGVDLTSAVLVRADLGNDNLTSSRLIGSNCREANFTNVALHNSFIDSACFHGANLTGAHLVSASRIGTDFTKANLTGSFLATDASSAIFDEASLLNAIEFCPSCKDTFCQTIMPDGSIRTDA